MRSDAVAVVVAVVGCVGDDAATTTTTRANETNCSSAPATRRFSDIYARTSATN